MNESFDKHFTSNADEWHTLARKGFVNTDDIVVYDSEYLDKVTELIYNRDEAALNYLIGVGICSYVKKGTKGIYVRYLHDDYVVVKFNGDIRPAIIPRSHISKQ